MGRHKALRRKVGARRIAIPSFIVILFILWAHLLGGQPTEEGIVPEYAIFIPYGAHNETEGLEVLHGDTINISSFHSINISIAVIGANITYSFHEIKHSNATTIYSTNISTTFEFWIVEDCGHSEQEISDKINTFVVRGFGESRHVYLRNAPSSYNVEGYLNHTNITVQTTNPTSSVPGFVAIYTYETGWSTRLFGLSLGTERAISNEDQISERELEIQEQTLETEKRKNEIFLMGSLSFSSLILLSLGLDYIDKRIELEESKMSEDAEEPNPKIQEEETVEKSKDELILEELRSIQKEQKVSTLVNRWMMSIAVPLSIVGVIISLVGTYFDPSIDSWFNLFIIVVAVIMLVVLSILFESLWFLERKEKKIREAIEKREFNSKKE